MGRAIWSGVLSFGLVSVPVELYTATDTHGPVFHQFEEGTADRIRYQRVNERTGDEVEYSDIVKGADAGGDYVLLDQDELDSVAPGRSRLMDIHTFVDTGDIDPLYFNKAYFLGPGGEETGKLYALLREAMEKAGKAAIASFVMRGREYLAAVRADRDILVLETLFFADEVRDPAQQIPDLPGRVKLSRQELNMARQLIEAMSGPWKPADYRDTYTDRVNDLIEAKKHKKKVQPAQEAPAATNVVDLSEALQSSVQAARAGSGRKAAAKKPGRKAPAKKPDRKKTGSRKSA
jgi:DNA end-binding protein Ku